jgi:preprotein translocase SecE subunit
MRAKGTWVLMFFVVSALALAAVLSHAFRDLFVWLQINNVAILGESFRLSTALAGGIALVLALFFGLFYEKSRRYIEQCVAEFSKVAFPEWKDTKVATFTVVVVSFIASIILGVFDAVFSWWTNNNLFIW